VRDLDAGHTTLISTYGPGRYLVSALLVGVSVPRHEAILLDWSSSGFLLANNLTTHATSVLATNALLAALSGNGRWLAYVTTMNRTNLMLQELDTGYNQRVPVPIGLANLSLSADGQFLAYQALDQTTGTVYQQVYVYDVARGSNRLASASHIDKLGGSGDSRNPVISSDGRYVIFQSRASNLVVNDTNGLTDVFVHDLVTETTFCLSTNRFGASPANGLSGNPTLGMDGRTVVFDSFASDLASGDDNRVRDAFCARLPFSDLEGDGMDDAWEITMFGDVHRNGQADADQDGMNDRNEYLAGTDPGNGESLLRMHALALADGRRVTIYWSAVPGKTYRVQWSPRLSEEARWQDLPGDVLALDEIASKVDDTIDEGGQERYYRIRIIP
jgi:hypothetical protein